MLKISINDMKLNHFSLYTSQPELIFNNIKKMIYKRIILHWAEKPSEEQLILLNSNRWISNITQDQETYNFFRDNSINIKLFLEEKNVINYIKEEDYSEFINV